jgi:hypothetical protein
MAPGDNRRRSSPMDLIATSGAVRDQYATIGRRRVARR